MEVLWSCQEAMTKGEAYQQHLPIGIKGFLMLSPLIIIGKMLNKTQHLFLEIQVHTAQAV